MLPGVVGQRNAREILAEERWKAQPEGVTAPDAKRSDGQLKPEYSETRVPQGTRNPAGSRVDHHPSLNTIW